MLKLTLAFQLGIGDIGEAVLNTNPVGEPPERPPRTEKIPKNPGTVERGRIVINVNMRVRSVNMRHDKKA